jgi:hypothetical protein
MLFHKEWKPCSSRWQKPWLALSTSGSTGNVANYMGQMAMAMGKLGTLENFLRQVFTLLLECTFGLDKGLTELL